MIRELEKIFIHRGNEWFISVNANDKYDLPYEYYLTYNKGGYRKLNKVKKIKSVNFSDGFVSQNNNKENNTKVYSIAISYIDNNNVKVTEQGVVSYNYETKLWDANLYNLYYQNTDKAKITLHNHIYDKEKESRQKLIELEEEEIAANKKKYEEEITGIHKEHIDIFDGRAHINLYHYKDDDKWEYVYSTSRFKKGSLESMIEASSGKYCFKLPYTEEMTIKKVAEKFLNDREQVKKALEIWGIDIDAINEENINDIIKENTAP